MTEASPYFNVRSTIPSVFCNISCSFFTAAHASAHARESPAWTATDKGRGTQACPAGNTPVPPRRLSFPPSRAHLCSPEEAKAPARPPTGNPARTDGKATKKTGARGCPAPQKARKDKARMQETHWQSSLRKGTSRAGKNIFLFFPHKAFAISKRLTTFATANAKSLFAEVAGKPLGGGPFVYRLGRKIFILERGVRFPHGLQ